MSSERTRWPASQVGVQGRAPRRYKVDEVDSFLDRVEATLNGDPGAHVGAQEVHDVVFRVRFGGYDEWQVDLHLDRVERQLAEMEDRAKQPGRGEALRATERPGPPMARPRRCRRVRAAAPALRARAGVRRRRLQRQRVRPRPPRQDRHDDRDPHAGLDTAGSRRRPADSTARPSRRSRHRLRHRRSRRSRRRRGTTTGPDRTSTGPAPAHLRRPAGRPPPGPSVLPRTAARRHRTGRGRGPAGRPAAADVPAAPFRQWL